MSSNADVSVAILAAWNGADLNTAVPGGLHTIPLTSRPTKPYATLEVSKDPKPNQFQSDGQYWDFRRVKIVLYGVGHAALGAIVSQVLAGLWKNGNQWITLSIPNAVGWLRTEYLSDEIKIEDPVQGEDVRSGPMEFLVWSQRNQP